MISKTLAAIDVGTNSFHLIVARLLGERKFSVIAKDKIVVRLGESPSQIKLLSEKAMERGVQAMQAFSAIAARFDAPVRAVATSAVREAENGEEFIRRVHDSTGIEIEVVSGLEEARLIYLGVLQALPVYKQRVALFDIGGGSTEFLIGESGQTIYTGSFRLGAIRMTQRFFPDERISDMQLSACRLYVGGEIYHSAKIIRESGHHSVVATSGTAQTIAAMTIAARGERVPESLNGMAFSREDIRRVVKRVLSAKTIAERSIMPGVDPRRADILAAGCVVLDTIMKECDFESFTVSSFALREGIVLDTIQQWEGSKGDGLPHLSNLRFQSVNRIGKMYNFDEAHAHHVAKLALSIYDALSPLHHLEDDSRALLEASALLHDVGYYISHTAHHRHSQYLIRNSEAFGFTNDEIEVIAAVARYHRKSHPKNRHEEFAALPVDDQNRVRILAGVLRAADGMDRTLTRAVQSVETSFDDRTIFFTIKCRAGVDPTFELWSLERKKGLLEETFGREVVLRVKGRRNRGEGRKGEMG